MFRTFDEAKKWLERGYAVIPIAYRAKTPKVLSWKKYQNELPTMRDLEGWFLGAPRNLAVVMGWHNLVVIDFDYMPAYELWRAESTLETLEVKTARGAHVYVRVGEPVGNTHTEFVDVKARGYVLCPPSVHPNGHQYEVLREAEIAAVESLADVLPEVLRPAPVSVENAAMPAGTQYAPEQADIWSMVEPPLSTDRDMIAQLRERNSLLVYFPDAERTSADGRWFVARCPFHDDQRPSFWIDTARQICGCYVCNMVPMDVINLFARLHGVSNRDAVFSLAQGGF